MCFSATASFAASGGLALAGVASLRAARPKDRAIAVIPLVFAVQQALEGVQWLALDGGTTCQAAGYGFLAVAYIFWPVYIPAVVYALDRSRRPVVRWFLGLGIAVALWNLWHMLVHPLAIYTMGARIVYDLDLALSDPWAALYLIVVSGALLVSRLKVFFWGGVAVLVAAVAAVVLAWQAFPSVWCFFAAIASVGVYFYVARRVV